MAGNRCHRVLIAERLPEIELEEIQERKQNAVKIKLQ